MGGVGAERRQKGKEKRQKEKEIEDNPQLAELSAVCSYSTQLTSHNAKTQKYIHRRAMLAENT